MLVKLHVNPLQLGAGKFVKEADAALIDELRTRGVLDYKNALLLKNFLTERGKILPSRISGACAKHQRLLTKEIKQARIMALLPYTAAQF